MKRIMSLIVSLAMLLNWLAPLSVLSEESSDSEIQVKIVSVSEKAARKKTKKTTRKKKSRRKSSKHTASTDKGGSESAPSGRASAEGESGSESAPGAGESEDAPASETAGESAPEAPEAAAEGGAAGEDTPAADTGAADAGAEGVNGGQEEQATEKTPQEILAEMGVVRVDDADQPNAAGQEEPAAEQVDPEAETDGAAPEAAEGEGAEGTEGAAGETEAALGDAVETDAELAAREGEEGSEDSGLITERKDQSDGVVTNFSDLDNKDTTSTLETVEEHYDLFVDENGVYQLTFTIQEGTDDEEITIDLTNALNALQAYAGMSGSTTIEPGDTRVFQIWITSESGHTYKYKEGSFILTTPESEVNPPDIPENPVQGFDGQILDNEHTGSDTRDAYTNLPALQEMLKAQGLDDFDLRSPPPWAISQLQRDLKAKYETDDLTKAVMQCLVDYYSEKDNVKYTSFEEMLKQSPDAARDIENTAGRQLKEGNQPVQLPVGPAQLYDFWYNDIHRFVYGDEEDVNEATGGNKQTTSTTKTVYTVTDHDDGTVYDNCYTAEALGRYYVNRMTTLKNQGAPINDPAKVLIQVDPQTGRMTLGFANEDGSWAEAGNYDGTERTTTTYEASYNNAEWHDDPDLADATVADYMKGEDSEFWNKADAYFSQLLADGISADSASAMTKQYVEFMMATNADGALAGNGYQNTEWGWHNTIDLTRVDGEVKLLKVDENENPITDSEATFQIWTYKDTDEDGTYTENDDKYFLTALESEETDETTGEKKKTYGFVKYDSGNSSMTYTVDTTGGELSIDRAMLENIVYYLQEVAAPKGYDIDTTVYIICDDEETAAEAERMLKDTTVDTSKGFSYAGAVDSKKPLKIQIVNTKSKNPPSPPGDNPPGDNPPPVVTIADYDVPLAGLINMNEGDCFN